MARSVTGAKKIVSLGKGSELEVLIVLVHEGGLGGGWSAVPARKLETIPTGQTVSTVHVICFTETVYRLAASIG